MCIVILIVFINLTIYTQIARPSPEGYRIKKEQVQYVLNLEDQMHYLLTDSLINMYVTLHKDKIAEILPEAIKVQRIKVNQKKQVIGVEINVLKLNYFLQLKYQCTIENNKLVVEIKEYALGNLILNHKLVDVIGIPKEILIDISLPHPLRLKEIENRLYLNIKKEDYL